jgi:hypothetical protein
MNDKKMRSTEKSADQQSAKSYKQEEKEGESDGHSCQ